MLNSERKQNTLDNREVSKILVELSAIPVGGNGQISDQMADGQEVVENARVEFMPEVPCNVAAEFYHTIDSNCRHCQ